MRLILPAHSPCKTSCWTTTLQPQCCSPLIKTCWPQPKRADWRPMILISIRSIGGPPRAAVAALLTNGSNGVRAELADALEAWARWAEECDFPFDCFLARLSSE